MNSKTKKNLVKLALFAGISVAEAVVRYKMQKKEQDNKVKSLISELQNEMGGSRVEIDPSLKTMEFTVWKNEDEDETYTHEEMLYKLLAHDVESLERDSEFVWSHIEELTEWFDELREDYERHFMPKEDPVPAEEFEKVTVVNNSACCSLKDLDNLTKELDSTSNIIDKRLSEIATRISELEDAFLDDKVTVDSDKVAECLNKDEDKKGEY